MPYGCQSECVSLPDESLVRSLGQPRTILILGSDRFRLYYHAGPISTLFIYGRLHFGQEAAALGPGSFLCRPSKRPPMPLNVPRRS